MLCGCMMHQEVERRYKLLQYIAALIQDKCIATPFVHAHILKLAEAERIDHKTRGQECKCCQPASQAPPVHEFDTESDGSDIGRELEAALEETADAPDAAPIATTRKRKRGARVPRINAKDRDGPPSLYPICTQGVRASFCIACINWVRRLSRNNTGVRNNMIPLDNMMLFMTDPGNFKEPDKRTMFRLLQNLSIQYTHTEPMREPLCIINPYYHFVNPIADRIVHMFKKKYFRSYRFDTTVRHLWKKMRIQKSPTPQVQAGSGYTQERLFKQVDSNQGLLNDAIRIWWENNGMPLILENRVVAKYVRRMLRNEKQMC